jgi:hypothetical protein
VVVEIKKNNPLLYQCEECRFMYKEKEWARIVRRGAGSIRAAI